MISSAPTLHHKRPWYSPKAIARSIALRPRFYYSALARMVWPLQVSITRKASAR